jgi:predicted transport protein
MIEVTAIYDKVEKEYIVLKSNHDMIPVETADKKSRISPAMRARYNKTKHVDIRVISNNTEKAKKIKLLASIPKVYVGFKTIEIELKTKKERIIYNINLDSLIECKAFCKMIISQYEKIIVTEELNNLYNKAWHNASYDPSNKLKI